MLEQLLALLQQRRPEEANTQELLRLLAQLQGSREQLLAGGGSAVPTTSYPGPGPTGENPFF